MAEKAADSGVMFRPHFKTHDSVQVGKWFRDAGVDRITVSSAEMALKFAEAGWEDISIAFPANIREMDVFNTLAAKIRLNLLSDSVESTRALANDLKAPAGIFIEIDCGYGRSGIPFDKTEAIDALVNIIRQSDKLQFKGFLLHSGDTYSASDLSGIEAIYQRDISQLNILKEKYIREFPEIIISVGDTPSCSTVDDLGAADEIRPGNFVYYDLMQYQLGVCNISDIAVSVACPVTGIYPERNEIVIYGGAIHMSKETLEQNGKYFGLVVRYSDDGWSSPIPDTRLVSVSQEHGIIRTSPEFIQSIQQGDILGILPIHSCLTANLLKENMFVL